MTRYAGVNVAATPPSKAKQVSSVAASVDRRVTPLGRGLQFAGDCFGDGAVQVEDDAPHIFLRQKGEGGRGLKRCG